MSDEAEPTVVQSMQQSGSTEDLELVLNYLLAHKLEFVKDFLRTQALAHSYDKEELHTKLREYVASGQLTIDSLIKLLNEIEGWGDQHIYLYKATTTVSQAWQNESYVMKKLRDAKCHQVFNNPKQLVLPQTTTLSTVEWSNTRVRFIWIERRTWEERSEADDAKIASVSESAAATPGAKDGSLVWRAYRKMTARGIITFDWNLITDDAMLSIQRLPKGMHYTAARDRFETELGKFVDIDSFEKVRIADVVRKLETSTETRPTVMKLRSRFRSQITLESPSESHDIFRDDAIVEKARSAIGADATGLLGFLYWKPVPGQLSTELYTRLYGESDNDQRIGILAEHREADVIYVLSRIRSYCV